MLSWLGYSTLMFHQHLHIGVPLKEYWNRTSASFLLLYWMAIYPVMMGYSLSSPKVQQNIIRLFNATSAKCTPSAAQHRTWNKGLITSSKPAAAISWYDSYTYTGVMVATHVRSALHGAREGCVRLSPMFLREANNWNSQFGSFRWRGHCMALKNPTGLSGRLSSCFW